jgi:hypothetical protein
MGQIRQGGGSRNYDKTAMQRDTVDYIVRVANDEPNPENLLIANRKNHACLKLQTAHAPCLSIANSGENENTPIVPAG